MLNECFTVIENDTLGEINGIHIAHWALLLDYLWAKLLTLLGYDSESTVTKETRKQAFLSSGCTSEDR